MSDIKHLKFRPYARLLTMLGDQLIRNEQVALVELVKNSYDADANWVKLTFENFDSKFKNKASSKIIIEDDGIGMSPETIENHWANPATPVKLQRKNARRGSTEKGREIQGEKGIGRFALLKLGQTIKITTRTAHENFESVFILDFSNFNSDFIEDDTAVFLDDLSIELQEIKPPHRITGRTFELGTRTVIRPTQGTRIEITNLKDNWSEEKIISIYNDLLRMQPAINKSESVKNYKNDDFETYIYRNEKYFAIADSEQEKLEGLLENRPVFHIKGIFDNENDQFVFSLDNKESIIKLDDIRLTGMKIFRDNYDPDSFPDGITGIVKSGSFGFDFYFFDFSSEASSKYRLDELDKQIIKKHRIYLYRDGIRVYPYGNPDDDWLSIDVRRGTIKASEFLSNDQVVGYVYITQEGNPRLKDKTSREGLVDNGNATKDFVALLQIFLAWVRKDPFSKYKFNQERGKGVTVFREDVVQNTLDAAVKAAQDFNIPMPVRQKLTEAIYQYKQERRYLVQRAETTEHLAGVGLSVESATHDLTLAIRTAITSTDALVSQVNKVGEINISVLSRELISIRENLDFIADQLKDMQLLFRSTKQRRKDIKIRDLLTKVERLFSALLIRSNIDFKIEEIGHPLIVKTTDAVLLQVLLNLFDNSIYWLKSKSQNRKIIIQLNGNKNTLIFSDNGPGIREEDVPYIFEPFYTSKAEDGRGLGLYIARQLLERHDYSIGLADKSESLLSGANFIIFFVKDEL